MQYNIERQQYLADPDWAWTEAYPSATYDRRGNERKGDTIRDISLVKKNPWNPFKEKPDYEN